MTALSPFCITDQASRIVWVDLETTGDSFALDDIIEAGVIITDAQLNVLAEHSVLVKPRPHALRRVYAEPVVLEMHTASGLLADLNTAMADPSWSATPQRVGRDLIRFAEAHGCERGQAVMGGSGINHFDRPFIAEKMPELHHFLHPRNGPDIGVLRRAYRMFTGGLDLSEANDHKTHRAIDDIRCHLDEARAFAAIFRDAATHAA